MEKQLLTWQNVNFRYGQEEVLKDISFTVAPGEVVCLVGESGAGKTTILKLCLGLKYLGGHHSGKVAFQDVPLFGLPEEEACKLRGRHIGMIFQNATNSLCPVRRIKTQVVEYARAHTQWSKEEILERAADLLLQVGFKSPADILDGYAFQLSGGMNQRLGIVLGLLLEPELVLADEPTSALDSKTQKEVLELLSNLQQQKGMGLLLISHDLAAVESLAHKIIVLQKGRIVEMGTKEEIFTQPQHSYTKALLRAGGYAHV